MSAITKPNRGAAAAQLEGLTLLNGWKVIRYLRRDERASGGHFSFSYLVERDGQEGFLKAFDFSEAFEPGQDTIKFLQMLTSAYEHEREVLSLCRDKRLSKVVVAIDHGDVQVPQREGMDGRVFYLIFEMAVGDIRVQVDHTKRFDTIWSMRALKDACLGLWQVHRQLIAHQDLKPSNVLVYEGEGFRIADFGRSSRKGHEVWYDRANIAGDRNYSPPELLYGFKHSDFTNRRIGCDLYLLGNLACFLFAGVNMTASIMSRMREGDIHYRVAINGFRKNNMLGGERLAYAFFAREAVLADHPAAQKIFNEALEKNEKPPLMPQCYAVLKRTREILEQKRRLVLKR